MFQNYSPFLAKISAGAPSNVVLAKKVPTFSPSMIFRIVLYFMPLQMTTETPLSRAQSAEFTLDSIPIDNKKNCKLVKLCHVQLSEFISTYLDFNLNLSKFYPIKIEIKNG